MNNGILIGLFALFILLIGFISQELGITNLLLTPIGDPTMPDTSNFLSALINIIIVSINMVWSFVQIMTYQVSGIPVLLNTFIMVPLAFIMGYILIRIFRGGG